MAIGIDQNGGGGGGGTIAGTIASGQVAYGSAANTISGDASFTYDSTNHWLKVGSSTGTIDAPLHVRANSSEVVRMETGTTFPVYMQGKNFLADDIGRVEFATVSNRGGVLDFSTKPADNVQATASAKRMRLNASGNLGLGNINQINERLSVSSHTGFSNSAFNFATAGVATTNNTQTVLWSKTLDDEFAFYFTVKVLARRTDSGTENGRFARDFMVYRGGGGSATLGATVVTPYVDELYNGTGWNVTIDALTNDVRILVTGENAKTIIWVARIEYQAAFSEF